MSTLYLYFSGTGNTKLVMETYAIAMEANPMVHSIEHNVNFSQMIQSNDTIVFAYPIYESMMPHIMQEFVQEHRSILHDKTIDVLVTQMLFSGDGAALLWRMIAHQNNTIRHTIHVNMPNNLTDVHLFRAKAAKDRTAMVEKSLRTLQRHITYIKTGGTMRMGRKWYSRFLGLFVQRLYAKPLYDKMRTKLKVNHETCISCNKCVPLCPTNNLIMEENRIIPQNRCTLCYRCINTCPTQALSLFMKHGPKTQYIRDTYR